MLRHLLFTLLALAAGTLQAATLIEVKTPDGLTRIYSDGPRARMELQDRSYMLVDSNASTMYVVMPQERRVMDMSHALQNPPPAAAGAGTITFDKQGSGPRIAGYQTTRYRFTADGKACGSVLASQKALGDSGLQNAFDTLQRLSAHADAMLQTFNQKTDPCVRAGNRLSAQVKKIGIPMRITLASGRLVSEIVRIENNTAVPANAFSIPAGYQKHNTGRMVQEAQQQLRQLQDSGQIPPELLRQLQQMQRPPQP